MVWATNNTRCKYMQEGLVAGNHGIASFNAGRRQRLGALKNNMVAGWHTVCSVVCACAQLKVCRSLYCYAAQNGFTRLTGAGVAPGSAAPVAARSALSTSWNVGRSSGSHRVQLSTKSCTKND